MKRKKIILSVLLMAVLGGGWYGYGEYTRKVKDLQKVKADVQMLSSELIAVFEKNEKAANENYLDKIIAVKGTLKAIEKNDMGNVTIVLGDKNSMSSVRCSMDDRYAEQATAFAAGFVITMKGACTGFSYDDLLGSDVILNRCVAENEK